MSERNLSSLKPVIEALFKDLKAQKERGIKPDLIFFTGDLINKGETAEVEFPLVSTHLLEPLLQELNLSQDKFFAIPGNHEIDRKKVCEEVEVGLTHRITTPEKLREYYHSVTRSDKPLPGFSALQEKLSGYAKFSKAFQSQHVSHSCFFYEAYKVPMPKLKVGVIGFNSAWRSSQLGSDGGRLLIGDCVVEEAAEAIKDCDLKLALCHHPFEMLAEWDGRTVRRRIAKEFDMLFTGHIHDSELSFFQQTFGGFFVSTSGCLNGGGAFNLYSLLEIDFAEQSVACHLRKWYPDRREFDQETEKAKDGVVRFQGFKSSNPKIAERIAIHEFRERLQAKRAQAPIVNPLEGVVQLSLKDVFVEPVISDTSTYERNSDGAKFFTLSELLQQGGNLAFYGRSEYGKSLLLAQAEARILNGDRAFEGSIPVLLKFEDLPNKNPRGIIHLIRRALGDVLSEEKICEFLEGGVLIVLLDDFNDRRAKDPERKCAVFAEFFCAYPKARYILSLTEHLTQAFHSEALQLGAEFQTQSYFIWSFTTSKIRQLLIKVDATKQLNVEEMLEQILFYFQQLQIPVTPLAVTLFIGVLFRDKSRKNIQNEAYLVENYLETILEKLDPSDKVGELDFREKESFLAHIAFRMLERSEMRLRKNDFEREKLDYFELLEEDIPNSSVFEDFFRKGILCFADDFVSFKFRFWFDFFLAKAMEKDDARREFVLGRSDYLRYSTALAYKAGLSRNDRSLLVEIDRRAAMALKAVLPAELVTAFEETSPDVMLTGITDKIDSEIRERNNPDAVDKQRDALLNAASEVTEIAQDDGDMLGELVTLHSDILRNTREVSPSDKIQCLHNNVKYYCSLMWLALDGMRKSISEMDGATLEKFLFRRMLNKKDEVRIARIIEQSHRVIYQVVPVSVILYMTDHLGNPKLARSTKKVLDMADGPVEGLFCTLLLCKLSLADGLGELEKYLSKSRSPICDFIAFVFLRIYTLERVLKGASLDRVIAILESIRSKYQQVNRNLPPHVKDTFRPDMIRKIVASRSKEK